MASSDISNVVDIDNSSMADIENGNMTNSENEYVSDVEGGLIDDTLSGMERLVNVLRGAPLPTNSQGRVRGYPTRGRSRGRPRGRKSGTPRSEDNYNDNTTKLPDEVTKILNDVIVSMREQLDYLRTLDGKLTDVLTTVKNLEGENTALKATINEKDKVIQDLETRIVKLEQKERADKIIVTSAEIKNINDAHFHSGMSNLLSTKLKLAPAICAKFRYRKIGKNEDYKRALITVPDYFDRKAIFAAAKKNKPPGFFVNQALIESREKLFYEVRQIKRETEADFYVYTYAGNIFVKMTPTSDPVRINSVEDLNPLLAQ